MAGHARGIAVVIEVDRVAPCERQRKNDELVTRIRRDVQGSGCGVDPRYVETSAIRQRAPGASQYQFAQCKRRVVDLQFGEAPAQRREIRSVLREQVFEAALLLLEMLRLEEEALGPNDSAVR